MHGFSFFFVLLMNVCFFFSKVELSIFEKSPNGLGHIIDPMCREHGDYQQRSASSPLPSPPSYLWRVQRDNALPPPCQRHCPMADDDPPSFDSTRSAPDVIVHRWRHPDNNKVASLLLPPWGIWWRVTTRDKHNTHLDNMVKRVVSVAHGVGNKQTVGPVCTSRQRLSWDDWKLRFRA